MFLPDKKFTGFPLKGFKYFNERGFSISLADKSVWQSNGPPLKDLSQTRYTLFIDGFDTF